MNNIELAARLDECLSLIRNHRHVGLDARMKKLDECLTKLRGEITDNGAESES